MAAQDAGASVASIPVIWIGQYPHFVFQDRTISVAGTLQIIPLPGNQFEVHMLDVNYKVIVQT